MALQECAEGAIDVSVSAAGGALDFRETFDGATLCATGGVSTCDNTWTLGASSPNFQYGGLQGTYAADFPLGQETDLRRNVTERDPIYVAFMFKDISGNHTYNGNLVNIMTTNLSAFCASFKTSATASTFYVQATGGTGGTTFTLTSNTLYYIKLKYTKGTGANATIECWTSTNGTDWTARGSSTNGTSASTGGALYLYHYDDGNNYTHYVYDDIRTSASDINY